MDSLPKSVLVVDESQQARNAIIRALPPDMKRDVREAEDGIAALAACCEAAPDVLFLHLDIPEFDGYAVLAALRESPFHPMTIALSSDAAPDAERRALELGARAFVKKPAKPSEILGALSTFGL
jgi:CheY-like chemotaxis protein